MRALIINEKTREDIQKIISYAEKNIITANQLQQIMKEDLPPPGDNENFRCFIPMGFRVVFTIEEQLEGLCQHISISINEKGMYPNPTAVEQIMKEFGFKDFSDKSSSHVYIEEEFEAINVIQYINVKPITIN